MTESVLAPHARAAGIYAFIRQICASPFGVFILFTVIAFFVIGITADALAPFDPVKIDIRDKLASPSATHWLGTDQLGRDVLSRLIVGTKVACWLAITAVSIALFIGVALGLIAAYFSRWLDWGILLLCDTARSFPTIMLALTIVSLFGPSESAIVAIVVISTFPSYARLVRTQVMTLKSAEFILAQRTIGASHWRILLRHMLPNVIGPVVIVACMDIPLVIGIEAGLSFLGLGVRPPMPSWGTILNDGFAFIRNTPWIVLAGGLPLMLTTVAFTFLGERLRDILDPKLRD